MMHLPTSERTGTKPGTLHLFRNLGHHSDDLGDAGRNTDTHTRMGAPDGDVLFAPAAWAAEDRDLAPTREQKEAFADTVRQHDPTNPDGWIEHGNPNYATGRRACRNNCGSCSRSFADTYQGGTPIAAHGDSKFTRLRMERIGP